MPIRSKNLTYSSASRNVIIVNQVIAREPAGRLINPHLQTEQDFSSTVDLVNQMELLFDRQGFPQAYNQYRRFHESQKDPRQFKEVHHKMTEEFTGTVRGEKATFVIQVLYRQNSTWQGSITWVEKQKTQRFRSTLEMIKLMDDVLCTTEIQEEIFSWDENE